MRILGPIRHHAVVVTDLAAAIKFYAELGFSRIQFDGFPDQEFIHQLSGGAWCGLQLCKLANDAGDVVECLLPTYTDASATSIEVGWNHIALTVEDCSNAIARLCGLGATRVGGPVKDPDAPYRVGYLRDPWGNLIEVVEAV